MYVNIIRISSRRGAKAQSSSLKMLLNTLIFLGKTIFGIGISEFPLRSPRLGVSARDILEIS